MSEPIVLVAQARAKEGCAEELGAAFLGIVPASRADAGCLVYRAHRRVDDPAVWMIYEKWASQADLDAHAATPHLQGLLAKLPELADGGLELVAYTQITDD